MPLTARRSVAPTLLSLGVALALGACGGSSGSDPVRVGGSLVVPDSGETGPTAARMIDGAGWLFRMTPGCPDVPAGYRPLDAAEVVFLDGAGTALGAPFGTDECGRFDALPPAGAVRVRARADGFRDLLADVSLFAGAGPGALASTIPTGASYRIGSLARLDASRVGFTVTDSESGQAVLGLPASAFGVRVDDADVAVASLGTAALTPSFSVTTLVLDASPSMNTTAYTDPDTSDRFSRSQLAARAAHVFLDQKADTDEVSVTVFSGLVYPFDQAFVDDELTLETLAGEPTAFTVDPTGFSTDASSLRFAVDLYNRRSDVYALGTDPRHPDTPDDLTVTSGFPFRGSTAFHDAVVAGVERVSARDAESRFVVALSDGRDNSSSASLEDAVVAAQSAGVAVYTVGFGAGADDEELDELASRTGASYFKVESLDVGDAFQSIQSGIVFRYVAALAGAAPGGVALDAATRLTITLDYGDERVVREIDL